jgi:hypothetical protein
MRADLGDVQAFLPAPDGGGARDNAQSRDRPKGVDDFGRDPFAERLLRSIRAQILEWQHRNRSLVRLSDGWRRHRRVGV